MTVTLPIRHEEWPHAPAEVDRLAILRELERKVLWLAS